VLQIIDLCHSSAYGNDFETEYKSGKIDLIHTHPVVTCVTLPNMGPIPLNSHFAMGTSFTENLIWLA
jgi:hypothetical protein